MRTALAALALLLGTAAARADGARVEVPIRQTVLSDGTPRYSIPISIGGTTVEAMFDTGSFGLRVLASGLAAADYQATQSERRYPFGSGALLEGPIADATISVGGLATPAPIGIQVVRAVVCAPRKPRCPASRIPPDQYGIGGDGLAGQGFKAILGTSLRRAPAALGANNPFPALGASSWIVVLPRPDDGAPGRLILNPSPDETAAFTRFQLEPQSGASDADIRGWTDGRLPGCFAEAGAKPFCAPTLLDTGADAVIVMMPGTQAEKRAGAGVSAEITLTQAGRTFAVPFVTGQGLATKLLMAPPTTEMGPHIQAGALPFYTYAVLYDAKEGIVGLGPRPAP